MSQESFTGYGEQDSKVSERKHM